MSLTLVRILYILSAIVVGYMVFTFEEATPHLLIFAFAAWVGGLTAKMIWDGHK